MMEGGDFCFTGHLCPHAAALLKEPPPRVGFALLLSPRCLPPEMELNSA